MESILTGLRLFFRIQPRVRAQLQRWTLDELEAALDRLSNAEAECKRTGLPSAAVCGRALMQVASLRLGARR